MKGGGVPTVQPNHPSLQRSTLASCFPCPLAQQSIVQVLNEAEVGLAGASVGAGGERAPCSIALHCTVTTKNNLNVIECTKLWFLKKEKKEGGGKKTKE